MSLMLHDVYNEEDSRYEKKYQNLKLKPQLACIQIKIIEVKSFKGAFSVV